MAKLICSSMIVKFPGFGTIKLSGKKEIKAFLGAFYSNATAHDKHRLRTILFRRFALTTKFDSFCFRIDQLLGWKGVSHSVHSLENNVNGATLELSECGTERFKSFLVDKKPRFFAPESARVLVAGLLLVLSAAALGFRDHLGHTLNFLPGYLAGALAVILFTRRASSAALSAFSAFLAVLFGAYLDYKGFANFIKNPLMTNVVLGTTQVAVSLWLGARDFGHELKARILVVDKLLVVLKEQIAVLKAQTSALGKQVD